ncbi:HAD-like protein [Atractiella rhizophila]|nr:HAD-like protein [Atractiella rhizophila]
MVIKAVIFDVGGVVVGSPLVAIVQYSKELGMPAQYLNVMISSRGATGVWQKLERGEIELEDFLDGWQVELNDWLWGQKVWTSYQKSSPDAGSLPASAPRVDSRKLFGLILSATTSTSPEIVHLLQSLRRLPSHKKVTIAALTNNFHLPSSTPSLDKSLMEHNYVRGETLKAMFDFMVESWKVGMRKPEKRIYEHTQKVAGVEGNEMLFLDDIGGNLKAAQELGWNVIRVYPNQAKEAVTKVEEYLEVEKGSLSGLAKM